MKKTWLAVLMLAVTSSVAFAQKGDKVDYDEMYHSDVLGVQEVSTAKTSPLKNKVESSVVRASHGNQKANTKEVEQELQVLRRQIHNLTRHDSAAIMQGIVRLADTFLDEVSENPRTQVFKAKEGTNVHALVSMINEPIRAGWKSQDFFIAEEIKDFLSYRFHEICTPELADELGVFLDVLKKYPFYADMETNLRYRLLRFRDYVANAKEEKMSVIMQSLVFLADDYYDAYAQEPYNKTETFVAKPELVQVAAKVAREIDQEIEVGWAKGVRIKPSDYVGYNIIRWEGTLAHLSPADELNAFVRALTQAAQTK